MCYATFIATSTPLKTSEFIPNLTRLYLKIPDTDELIGLSDKFSLPFVYYVGSDTKCSCGFEFHSELFDDPEWQDSKASPQALLDLLNELTISHDVEYYCCWDGDWGEPIEHNRVLNSHYITLEKNYFELIEREFIKFESLR
ncbi:MAG TPA: hypothetical protein VGN20_26090 [Mucilaginibacter sp.]|jgi:hypothetical protein